MQPAEQELIGRMQAGDNTAVADLASMYGPRIHQLAFRYLKNWEDAEEVTQDVLMKVHRKIDPKSEPKPDAKSEAKGKKTKVIPIKLGDILTDGNLTTNIELNPGDVVTVPERLF